MPGPFGNQVRLTAFDAYLRANGIPIDGVSGNVPYGPTTVTIQFQPSATQQQIDWANQALQTFDWRDRTPLTYATIASNFAGLTTAQQNAFQRRAFAWVMRSMSPADLAQLFVDIGVTIPVDQVAP